MTGFHRPNLVLHATPVAGRDRLPLLLDRLRERPDGPTIVYVTLQRQAEDVASALSAAGHDARAYHAGMDDDRRNQVQEWFMASGRGIVVATIAFGMGIDKADIRYVYHLNLPKTLENYAQEVGRAGRDGKASVCELFAAAEDVVTLENFTYGDTPTAEAVGQLMDDVLGRGEMFDVSTYELSSEHDIRILVVSTLLTYLELEGVIEATGPFYTGYKVRTLRPLEAIYARFDARRAAFLREVFTRGRPGTKWITIEVRDVAAELGESPDRINAALNYLQEQGDAELQVTGLRQGYRRLPDPPIWTPCENPRGPVPRTGSTRRGQSPPGAGLRVFLGLPNPAARRHFGEQLGAPCGHCARCLGEPVAPLPPAPERRLGPGEEKLVRSLLEESHPSLAGPRQVARFLTGLTSPATSRAPGSADTRRSTRSRTSASPVCLGWRSEFST
ncbi:MAG: helicase-related protein [Isosphaeraceae bacterium]